MNNINNTTPFSIVYDNFLSKITDDMYMELNELDTFRILEDLLILSFFISFHSNSAYTTYLCVA